jgi:hypothetical protein
MSRWDTSFKKAFEAVNPVIKGMAAKFSAEDIAKVSHLTQRDWKSIGSAKTLKEQVELSIIHVDFELTYGDDAHERFANEM